LAELGVDAIMLDPAETKLGGVETHHDAGKCAELFRKHRDRISGVLVRPPNFGDEKGVADTLKLAGLNVSVLVQGCRDDLDRLDVIRRRDAFCGKISVCNNLRQAGIAFTLTRKHVVHPLDASFRADLHDFLAVCRVVQGLRKVRSSPSTKAPPPRRRCCSMVTAARSIAGRASTGNILRSPAGSSTPPRKSDKTRSRF
jgi:L-fucose isomerase-like protein